MTEVRLMFLCSNSKEIKGTNRVFIRMGKTAKKSVLNRYFEYFAKTKQKFNKESRRNLKSMAKSRKNALKFQEMAA